jgi:hypothetical protein
MTDALAAPPPPPPNPARAGRRTTILWALVLAAFVAGVVYPLRRYVVEPRRQAILGFHEAPGRRLALASQFAFDTAAGYSVRMVPGAPALGLGDLSGQAMTLVLGGFRGPYVAWLWSKVEEDKQRKIHFDLIDRYLAIASLQSDYPQVWVTHAWNMAYNLSVQWQSPEMRYRWIRHAVDFLKEGYRRNPHSAEIMTELGWIYSDKLGRSQEAPFYRRRVEEDEGRSAFLIAYEWFDRARRTSERYGFQGHGLSQMAVYAQACHAANSYATEITQRMLDALQASVDARKAGRATEAGAELARGLDLLEQSVRAWMWARDEWHGQAARFERGTTADLDPVYGRFFREATEMADTLKAAGGQITPTRLPHILAEIKRPEL